LKNTHTKKMKKVKNKTDEKSGQFRGAVNRQLERRRRDAGRSKPEGIRKRECEAFRRSQPANKGEKQLGADDR
jgi:hypothetical protein